MREDHHEGEGLSKLFECLDRPSVIDTGLKLE